MFWLPPFFFQQRGEERNPAREPLIKSGLVRIRTVNSLCSTPLAGLIRSKAPLVLKKPSSKLEGFFNFLGDKMFRFKVQIVEDGSREAIACYFQDFQPRSVT